MIMNMMNCDIKNTEYRSGIAERLVELRTELHLNISDFCILINYSITYYYNIEAGRAVPAESFIHQVCRETGAEPDWLLHGTGTMGQLKRIRDDRDIARRLVQLRRDLDLTQVEFSRLTQLSQSTVSRIEKCAREGLVPIALSLRQLANICEACNVGYEWLVFGDEKAKENPCNEEMIRFLKAHPQMRERIVAEIRGERLVYQ